MKCSIAEYHFTFIQETIYSILKKPQTNSQLIKNVTASRVGSWDDFSEETSLSAPSGARQRQRLRCTSCVGTKKRGKKPFCSNSGGSGKKTARCLPQAASLEDSPENAATSRQAFTFNWNIYFPPHHNSLSYIATYVTEDVKYILSVMVEV